METMITSVINRLYGINPLAITQIDKGFLTHNKIIKSSKGSFFLKQHRLDSTDKIEYIEEVESLFFVNNIPVILPIPNQEGSKHFYFGESVFALYPFVEGIQKSFEELENTHIRSLATLLAKMHSISAHSIPDKLKRETREAWDSKKSLDRFKMIIEKIKTKDVLNSFDKNVINVIDKKILFITNNKISYMDVALTNDTIIHGDYWQDNIFFKKNASISHVFDFEKASFSSHISELIRSIFIICFNGNFEDSNFHKARIFLESYSSIYKIDCAKLSKAIDAYIIRLYHSTWIENEHYIKDNFRLDILYTNTVNNILYFNDNIEIIKSVLLSYV